MDVSEKKEQIYACSSLSLQQALNALHRIVENPVILFDTSYQYITCCENYISADPIWNEFIDKGCLSHATMDSFNTAQIIQAVADSDVVTIIKSPIFTCDRINAKIFNSDKIQIANINMMAEQTPLTEQHPELLEAACEVLAPLLLKSPYFLKSEPLFTITALLSIIEGIQLSKKALADLYLHLKPFLYVAVIDPNTYEKTNTHLGYFRDLFRKIQPEHEYYVYQHQVLALINTDYKWISPIRDIPQLASFCDEYNIHIAVSGVFQDLYELNARYRESLSALNYGLRSCSTQHFFNYESFRLERFINANRKSDNELVSPLAKAMISYDQQNNTDYVNTFYMHVLHGNQLSLTATACNKTEQQISDALAEITQLFGCNFWDIDMLTNILYSLRHLKDTN